jgi:hypothetical protein
MLPLTKYPFGPVSWVFYIVEKRYRAVSGRNSLMKHYSVTAIGLLLCTLIAGCASSEITQRQSYAAQDRLPRPGRIIVYDIRASATNVPASAAITGRYSLPQQPQTAEELRTGRQLGAQVGHILVKKILDMGMPAQRAGYGPPPVLGDVLITGQFITIEKGTRAERVIIGFGAGRGELKTHIEGYLVTPTGHRLLGTRDIATAGGKKPGLLVPGIVAAATSNPAGLIASSVLGIRGERITRSETLEGAAKRTTDEIAKELKKIFRRQGWI